MLREWLSTASSSERADSFVSEISDISETIAASTPTSDTETYEDLIVGSTSSEMVPTQSWLQETAALQSPEKSSVVAADIYLPQRRERSKNEKRHMTCAREPIAMSLSPLGWEQPPLLNLRTSDDSKQCVVCSYFVSPEYLLSCKNVSHDCALCW